MGPPEGPGCDLRAFCGAFSRRWLSGWFPRPRRGARDRRGGNYEKAFERAQSEAKPVLADFGATWREPCAVMDRDVWSRADVAAAAARFVVVKIDIDVRADLVRTLGLEGAPTLILADPWGREIVRKVGEITTLVGHITDSSMEQTSATEEVARSMEEISALTEENAATIRQVGRSVNEVSSVAAELQQLVGKFRV